MAKPIAYFGYSKLGLTVNFYNNSLNSPESYEWDFGDGDTSEDKNPSHTYNEEGFFTVSLKAINIDGESEPLVLTIGVGDTSSTLNQPIIKIIDEYLPTILRGDAGMENKALLISKWQSYLQPLVEIPHIVLEADTYNEYKWPGLINNLIGQLVAYDIMSQSISQFLTSVGPMVNTVSEDEEEDTTKNKQIKSIETGPAKTEWHEWRNSVSNSEIYKNLGQAFRDIMKQGGALDLLKNNICQQASRLRIFLPICGQLAHNTVVPSIVSKPKRKGKHNANPFGITKRML